MRRGLRNRGVAVCIACDYDLAAQVALRCPECGEPFDPALLEQVARIEPDEPRGPTGA